MLSICPLPLLPPKLKLPNILSLRTSHSPTAKPSHAMRPRFLATDCSSAASTASGEGGPVETLDFVRLPLPHIPPLNYTSFSANFLQSFDEIPVFGISGEIDKLLIEEALSIFLSDDLPQVVDGAGFEEPRIDGNKKKPEVYVETDGDLTCEAFGKI